MGLLMILLRKFIDVTINNFHMKLITFIFLLVFFSSCQQIGKKKEQVDSTYDDSKIATSSNLGETKENGHLICSKADSISLIFNKFMNEKNIDNINTQLLYQILRQNDLDESNCHFPRNHEEIELFNRFTIELLKKAETYDKAILLLIYIFDTSRRNIELIEFLQSKLADQFIYNTGSYINAIMSLDDEKRNRAIAVAEFVNNKEELLNLRGRIGKYKVANNVEIINDIEKKLDEEIGR